MAVGLNLLSGHRARELYSLRIPVPDTASMFLFEEIIVRGWELRSPRTILSSSRNKVAVGELVAWWCGKGEGASLPPFLTPQPSNKFPNSYLMYT